MPAHETIPTIHDASNATAIASNIQQTGLNTGDDMDIKSQAVSIICPLCRRADTYRRAGPRKASGRGYKWIQYLTLVLFSVPGELTPPLTGSTQGVVSDIRRDTLRNRAIASEV